MTNNIYVAQVEPRGEDRFIKSVKSQPEFKTLTPDADGFFYWPRRELLIRKQGRRTVKFQPLFAGYVFLVSETIDKPLQFFLRRQAGFVRFLRDNRNIEPLPGEERRWIKRLVSLGENIGRSEVYFMPDQKIRVLSGPLMGMEGSIVKVDRRKKRAKVKLSLYENSFLIDFGLEILTRTESEK